MKTIISLFDYTGNWSKPYRDNGFNVIQVDIKLGCDILEFDYQSIDNVYGILSALPCTDFASSGARWWKEKDARGGTNKSLELFDKMMNIIKYHNPVFWCLENPIGRLPKLRPELGKPVMYFNPCDFAGYSDISEAYTKKTCLWGKFNPDLVKHPVEPILGSKMHRLPPSKERQTLRSITPIGFTRAFFNANH